MQIDSSIQKDTLERDDKTSKMTRTDKQSTKKKHFSLVDQMDLEYFQIKNGKHIK